MAGEGPSDVLPTKKLLGDASESAIIIDIEASGLGPAAYPIAIALGWEDGRVEHYYVRPPRQWLNSNGWSPSAQRIHRISQSDLIRLGMPVTFLADWLNATLAGAMVYSDAPDYDTAWLQVLHRAAGCKQRYSLNDIVGGLIPVANAPELPSLRTLAKAECPGAIEHTANGDVRLLWKMVELARSH